MDQSLQSSGDSAIRDEVAKLCAGFPGEYWRALDARRGYPTEFVAALRLPGMRSGFETWSQICIDSLLAARIPSAS